MIIKDAELVGIGPWLKFIWKGHITNWLWKDSQSRRLTRQHHYQEMKIGYFDKYIPFIKALHSENKIQSDADYQKEIIFSLWLQGIDNAPDIVQTCIASIKEIYGERLIVLDERSMYDYINLPSYIIDKWKNKKIGAANFSDIVRIELLTQYGGYWCDATDYMLRPIPEAISDSDFFMYVTSPVFYTHMFVQTCFIRAKQGDALIKMWRDLVFEYWKNEEKSVDYFLVHLLFKMLVTYNPEAKALYEKMPKHYQDCLHELWFNYGNKPFNINDYNDMKQKVFFQKCSYRKQKYGIREIIPGSMAAHLFTKQK